MCYTIVIVGRSNVGKTTIFNRLIGKNIAITADITGVTRDRNEIKFNYYDMNIKLIDTAGVELNGSKNVIEKQMLEQANKSIDDADLCLFVIDGKTGLLHKDIEIFNILRKKNKTTILVINKSETKSNLNINELNHFNTAIEKIFLSAEHNFGFNELYKSIKKQHDIWLKDNKKKEEKESLYCVNDHKIKIAVLGRPNVGKSTFLNNLLNENRLITSNIAGTTRDKIELDFVYKNLDFVLVDTAGIRKKYKNGNEVENASIEKSFESLQFADVVIVMIDITIAFEEQDLSLCNRVCEEGRILIVCFNKWDLVPSASEKKILTKLKNIICKSISKTKGIVFFTCSAIHDNDLQLILDSAYKLYNKWNIKISSSSMNKKIEKAKQFINNPISDLKIRYINQIKTRPPTFVAFSGKDKKYIKQYKIDSLRNWLYSEFDLFGVPIRLSVREKK